MDIAQFFQLVRSLLTHRDERGASAVEYGLLVAGIAALVVSAVFLFGNTLNDLLGDSCGTITAYVTGKECGPSAGS